MLVKRRRVLIGWRGLTGCCRGDEVDESDNLVIHYYVSVNDAFILHIWIVFLLHCAWFFAIEIASGAAARRKPQSGAEIYRGLSVTSYRIKESTTLMA